MDVNWSPRQFFPDEEVEDIFEVNYQDLKARGHEAVIFDLDNTLSQWKSRSLDRAVSQLLKEVKQVGLQVAILSNGRGNDIAPFLEQLPYPVVFNAGKPSRNGYRTILQKLNVSPEQSIMIGDQLVTDILGGNRIGLYTIRVKPINPNSEYPLTKINRVVEKVLFALRSLYRSL